jgi:MFS family permease
MELQEPPDGMAAVRRLLFLVGAVVLVDTMFYAALTPLLPHYADELGLSKTGAGVLAGSYALGALLAGIPAGILATRLGVKPTILIGLGGMTITTALFGFAQSESVLVLARLLQGAASSCSWTAGLAWLIADAPANTRGRLIGSAMGVAIFGAMLGPVIGGIASVTSIEATFAVVACIGLGLAAWAAATPSRHEPSGQPVSLLFSALTKPRMLAGVWLVALPSISFGALGVLAPLHLDALGLGALAITGVWIVAISFEATAAPLVGYISDRRGRILPLLVGAAAASLCFVLFAALDARWWTYAAVIVACSFALGAFWAPSMSLASDEAEVLGLDYAFGFAIINLAWAPSQVAGSVGGGRLADVTSDTVVYLALAVLFTLTLAALWRSASSS